MRFSSGLLLVAIILSGALIVLAHNNTNTAPDQQPTNQTLAPTQHPPGKRESSPSPLWSVALSPTLYLPAIFNTNTTITNTHIHTDTQRQDAFAHDRPIWSHNTIPAVHEVVLFRHSFTLTNTLSQATLLLFADTRYEVWIDGEWVGRGPARFSHEIREYDSYPLGTLTAGEHLIAVQVQWAPNSRRSESTTPMLIGHIQGETPQGTMHIASTGTQWETYYTTAWHKDAALVHAWGLIGPTELLDLRRLPQGWMYPDYTKQEQWIAAVVKDTPTISPSTYYTRTIPQLVNVPMDVQVHQVGQLSPGSVISELPIPITSTVTFTATKPTSFTLETLAYPPTEPLVSTGVGAATLAYTPTTRPNTSYMLDRARGITLTLALDGSPLALETPTPTDTHERPPDVRHARVTLLTGTHTLALTTSHKYTLPILLSQQNLVLPTLPFSQTNHAGKRMLLAEPISNTTAVERLPERNLGFRMLQSPAYVILDMGRVVHGRFHATVHGSAGTIVDIGWDERLWHDTYPLPYPGSLHPQWNQTDSWILDGTSRTITTLDSRTGRYILIAVWGDAPVTFSSVQVLEERYPTVVYGQFDSPNPRLNQIWQVGVDTLASNMTDAYADPWRERGQWWGDAFIVDRANQVCFGETRLLRRGLIFMAQAFDNGKPVAIAPNDHKIYLIDYGMLWVQSIDDYLRMTGDTKTLTQLYPVVQSFLAYLEGYEHPTTHLLDIPVVPNAQSVLIDWAASGTSRYGQSTPLNALYYNTLQRAAAFADLMDDPTSAKRWRDKASRVKEQINTLLYSPNNGWYYSSVMGEKKYAPTPQAQAWTLTYGIVPAAEQERVADTLVALLSPDPSQPNVEIYGMFWVLEALGRSGRIQDGLDIMNRYYGRLLDLGATTWWEHFTANSSYTAALSHGWGSSPTWFLSTYALGAHRTGPQQWQITPGLQTPGKFSGTIPLQDGILSLAWDYPEPDAPNIYHTPHITHLEIASPTDSSGEVVIPANRYDLDSIQVQINDAPVWRGGSAMVAGVKQGENGDVVIPLTGGRYNVAIVRSSN
jgi:alpha-L-rhamnosidase